MEYKVLGVAILLIMVAGILDAAVYKGKLIYSFENYLDRFAVHVLLPVGCVVITLIIIALSIFLIFFA